jgi:threonine/homoserine/homoserine lactone efflux protein
MIELFLSAMAIGFFFNAAPGAVFTESLRRGLKGGFKSALYVQFGSLVGDLIWAIIGLGGAAVLFEINIVKIPMAIFGGVLLAMLAFNSLIDATKKMPTVNLTLKQKDRTELTTGVAISLTNPINITYWAGMAGTITTLGVNEPTGQAFIVFLSGFMLSSIIWCFLCAGFIGFVKKTINQTGWVIVNLSCGIGLAYFSIYVLLNIYNSQY